MLCDGDGYSWERDDSSPTNSDVVQAFSPSKELRLHCIINSAGREMFVAASSCRNAKIIAKFFDHLQGVSCGHCSGKELKNFVERGPQYFDENLKLAIRGDDPTVLWGSGYVSEQLSRLARERMERLMMGIRE